MSGLPAIVHLIGFPGVGKYTIAKELASCAGDGGERFVVIDNHLTANVVFTAIDVDGMRHIPPAVWARVGEVREALHRAIEELSPPEWTFVFTNVLTAQESLDPPVVARLQLLAEHSGRRYIPIRLHCDRDELLRRVVSTDRQERLKWRNADAVASFVDEHSLIDLAPHPVLDLDVTSLSPPESAQRILDHWRAR